MRIIKVLGKKDVRVPFTADGWELYTNDDETFAASVIAAEELNAQLERELARWTQMSQDGEFAPTRVAIDAAMRRFQPIMKKHADTGTQDAEPCSLLELTLVRIAIAMGADVSM